MVLVTTKGVRKYPGTAQPPASEAADIHSQTDGGGCGHQRQVFLGHRRGRWLLNDLAITQLVWTCWKPWYFRYSIRCKYTEHMYLKLRRKASHCERPNGHVDTEIYLSSTESFVGTPYESTAHPVTPSTSSSDHVGIWRCILGQTQELEPALPHRLTEEASRKCETHNRRSQPHLANTVEQTEMSWGTTWTETRCRAKTTCRSCRYRELVCNLPPRAAEAV